MRNAIFLIFTILMLFSANIFAHTPLKSSTPNHGDILKKTPTALILNFREGVRLAKVDLHKKNGEKIEINVEISAKPSANYTISLPTLEFGAYLATWVAIGADTHKIDGQIEFTVQADSNNTNASSTSAATEHTHH